MLFIYYLITTFIFLFIQNYINMLTGISLIPLFIIVYDRLGWKSGFPFFILILSLIFDVAYNYSLGSNLLAILLIIALWELFKKIAHGLNLFVKLPLVILVYVSYSLTLNFIEIGFNFSFASTFSGEDWVVLVIKGLVFTIIYHLISTFLLYFEGEKEVIRVR